MGLGNSSAGRVSNLEYTILEKGHHLVVNFRGVMSERTNHVINECQKEINSRNTADKFVILNFDSVVSLDDEVVGSIRGLQSAIRRRPAQIRVCCIRPEWKKIFSENDIFLKDEFGEGLESTIENISRINQ
ncbi:MAG: anti-sigma factor antagonist [Oligoflexia bacterium]|nr:anti-sigma factor antagonist [Oligoflexia bacterium]MBF0364628.1 anti-sigma factor antagonist [Oligoflexia bacterium]